MARARRREVRVGTSGWVYADWSGPFYPDGLRARDRLSYYAKHFEMVEINATHYRLASERAAASWQSAVPPGFRFVAKGSAFITHRLKLRGCERAVERFFAPLAPLTSLEVVLWQLPARMPHDLERVDRFLAILPRAHAGHRLRHVLEPRDPWWWSEETRALLTRHEVALCALSAPGLPDDVVPTSDLIYVRFHGIGDEPYLHDYRDDELAVWVDRLAPHLSRRDVYVAFNNDREAHAVANARRFRELMEAARPRALSPPARAAARTASRPAAQRSRGGS